MKKILLVMIISLTFAFCAFSDSSNITFVDVGQGDCTILQTGGKTLVFDLGPSKAQDRLESVFNDMNINEIDLLVLTHPHDDHDGNLGWAIENYDIREMWMPEYSDDEEDYGDLLRRIVSKGTKIRYPRTGESICIGDAFITVLSAEDTDLFDDKNLWSIVLKITCGTTSVMVMGDAEDINEYRMIDAGLDLKADVLRVGHHGSDTSTTEAFLEAVEPSYAVISCGWQNQYGHPTETVLQALASAGAEVYRTDLDGNITMSVDGGGYFIYTQDQVG